MVTILLLSVSALFAQTVPHVYVTHTEFINNESAPSASCEANYVLFLENGQFKYKDSSGNVYILGAVGLAEDKTVNLDNTMSTTEIQAEIDAQPKNLNGHTLTFQLANGTYSLDARLYFGNFYNGTLIVTGDGTQTSAGTSQNVVLSRAGDVIAFFQCASVNMLKCIRVAASGTGWNGIPVAFTHCGYSYVQYCSATWGDIAGAYNYFFYGTDGEVINSYCKLGYFGIYAKNCNVESNSNYSEASNYPKYGLSADRAGFIAQYGVQPSGSTAASIETNGGLIQ
jgi:hypothetical protein